MELIDFKRCPKCGEVRPRSEYYPKMDHGNMVLQGYCRSCERIRHREDYWKNPEKHRRRSKKNSFRFGRGCTAEADSKYNRQKKAVRLSQRLARASLITKLCMKEYEIDSREALNGRLLLGKYEECAVMSVWLIRKYTFLHRDAIAEIFNCSTKDVNDRIKSALKNNDWSYGDITFITKWKSVKKAYCKLKDKEPVETLPYESFTKAQLLGRENTKQPVLREPPVKNITTDQLIEVVCWYYNISWDDFLNSPHGRGNIAKARQVSLYILNKHFGSTLATLADMFSRDQNTIRNNVIFGKDIIRNNHGDLFYELHKRFPTTREENPSEEALESTHSSHPSS